MTHSAISMRSTASLLEGRKFLFVILAAVAVLFVLNTWHGIGMLPDSTRYMQIVSAPYDAPLYAWLLELGKPFGRNGDETAWVLGLALYLANAGLVFDIFRRALRGHPILAAFGILNVVVSPTFLWINTVAMSEALFLVLGLLAVRFFVDYIAREDRRLLAGSGVAVGLAMLARFVAPPLGAAFAGIALFYQSQRPLRERLIDVALFFVLSAGIFGIWAILSKLLVDRAVGRSMWFYGNADADRWLGGLGVLASYFVPQQIPDFIRLPVLAGILAYVIVVTARSAYVNWMTDRLGTNDLVLLVFGSFFVWYALFIFLSILIEANLQLNSRYLLPLYVSIVFVTATSAGNLMRGARPARLLGLLVVAGLAVLLASNGVRTLVQTRQAYEEGIGFRSIAWRTSPVIGAVRELPPNAIIYTNASDPLNYLTGRWTERIPAHSDRRTGLENGTRPFEEQLRKFREDMEGHGAYAVFVDAIDWRFYLASEDELVRLTKLKLVRSESDGRIYQAEKGG